MSEPKNPLRTLALVQGGFGLFAMIVGAGSTGSLLAGGFNVTVALLQFRVAIASEALARADRALQRGDLDEARRLAAEVVRRHRIAWIVASAELLQAEIAWREGDAEGARALCDRALAHARLFRRSAYVARLRALRALTMAARGESIALDELDRIREMPAAPVTALARVELAHAVSLSANDLDAAEAHLAKNGALLAEALEPTDRRLHRALRRRVIDASSTGYRAPARTGSGAVDAQWLRSAAPLFAPWAEEDPATLTPAVSLASVLAAPPPATKKVQVFRAKRRKVPRSSAALLALWTTAIAAFAAFWGVALAAGTSSPLRMILGTTVVVLGIVGAAIGVGLRARRRARRVLAAERRLARGDVDGAVAEIEVARKTLDGALAAHAELILAEVAVRRGSFARALEHAENGLSELGDRAQRMAAWESVHPSLIAVRALALAALDRTEESDAELERLHQEFGSYTGLSRATARVRLIAAMREGDRTRAAIVGRAALDVAVPARERRLAELAVALDDDDRIERAREELRRSPDDEAWVRAIAPWVFAREGPKLRVGDAPVDEDADEEDEGALLSRARRVEP